MRLTSSLAGWLALVAIDALAPVVTAPAAAQVRVATLDELRRELSTGDVVSVVGSEPHAIKGRLTRVGDADLGLLVEPPVAGAESGRRLEVDDPVQRPSLTRAAEGLGEERRADRGGNRRRLRPRDVHLCADRGPERARRMGSEVSGRRGHHDRDRGIRRLGHRPCTLEAAHQIRAGLHCFAQPSPRHFAGRRVGTNDRYARQ